MDKLIAEIKKSGWLWTMGVTETLEGDYCFIAVEYEAIVRSKKHSASARNADPAIALGMALGGLKVIEDTHQ